MANIIDDATIEYVSILAKLELSDEARQKAKKDMANMLDYVDKLIENKIPLVLVCGEKDSIVPYLENGAVLAKKYRDSVLPFIEILKPDCDHHPHGLNSQEDLIDFAQCYY